MNAGALTVLVVDDAPDFLAFLELLLSDEGYCVRTTSSLEEAERRLGEGLPDVVVADVMLQGHPPFALLDCLDANPTTRDLPVLLCTGAVHELTAERDRWQRPRTAALLKPFDIDHLLQCLARLAAGELPRAEHGAFQTDHQ